MDHVKIRSSTAESGMPVMAGVTTIVGISACSERRYTSCSAATRNVIGSGSLGEGVGPPSSGAMAVGVAVGGGGKMGKGGVGRGVPTVAVAVAVGDSVGVRVSVRVGVARGVGVALGVPGVSPACA